MTDPIVQARLTLDEAWRLTDELIAAEGEWLPGWLGGIGTGLDLVIDRRRPTMLATPLVPRRRRRDRALAAVLAALAIVVAACGGTTTPTGAASAGGSEPGQRRAPTAPAASGESPAASPAGYTGPPVTIKYSIWGDPQEIASQTAIADAFHAANPNITVNVDVSDWDAYWDKLQTGLAGGAAPGRVRDGRPAVPRLPGARRAARPQAATSTATGTT